MAKKTERLTDLAVKRLKDPGYHADGRGLYLQVGQNGSKSWLLRFTRDGKQRWMGLGAYPVVSLSEARQLARDKLRLLNEGIDPIELRKSEVMARKLDAARTITFKGCATAYIAAHEPSWQNQKHASQWTNTLKTYAFPKVGDRPVQDLDTESILSILEPIWQIKTETASRIRQRVEVILDWAKVRGYRTGENPARWRGHLDKILPKRSRVQKVKHHAAFPYADLPTFFHKLQARQAVSARALMFTILTAARTSEVRLMTWSEVDFDKAVWNRPAEHMKAKRPHRVPLTDFAMNILKGMRSFQDMGHRYVFPGLKPEKPMSENTMLKFLQEEMGQDNVTVHGFRSTFRDWAAEMTSYPRELAESALAHIIADKTEAAYLRGDMFERRRDLMNAWETYCLSHEAKG